MTNMPPNEHDVTLINRIIGYIIEGPELEFLVDLLKKAVVFYGIFLIAISINITVEHERSVSAHWLIIYGLSAIEYLLYGTDIVWFAVYIITSAGAQIHRVAANTLAFRFMAQMLSRKFSRNPP